MRIAVADASPLIILNRAGYLDCLAALFGGVKVPQAVFEEICSTPREDSLRFQLSGRPWIEVVRLPQPLTPPAYRRLGRGETEVIEFAGLNPDAVALLDDRAARRVATDLGIPVTGTLGVVAAHVSHEKTFTFDEAVGRLRQAGLYVDVEVVETVRRNLVR
jgi:predicted nucleic acid-binding protein